MCEFAAFAQRFACCDYSTQFNLVGYLEAVEALDGHPVAAMAAWLSNGCAADGFSDAYYGEWDDKVNFTEDLVDECGMLADLPDNLKGYFDYAAFARDLFINKYTYLDGFVFSKC